MAKLHPTMVKHAAAVKAAHAHLTATVPGFRAQPGHAQLRQTQAHVRATAGKPRRPTRGGY